MTYHNITLIGDSCVGKTTIANALLDEPYSTIYKPTIGASMVKIPFDTDGKVDWFYLWDTAGMEKYRAIAPVYYRGSEAAIVVFDVTNKTTFDHVNDWCNFYKSVVGDKLILIVGNKIDLLDKSEIDDLKNDVETYAKEIKAEYLFTSAKEKIGLKEIFKLLNEMLKSSFTALKSTGINLESKESGCCS